MIEVFLEFAKAFWNSLSFWNSLKLLLEKLERYKIRGNTLDLLLSYLSGKQQKVRLCKKIQVNIVQLRQRFLEELYWGHYFLYCM